jgi:iron complex outermembrane receptor protein
MIYRSSVARSAGLLRGSASLLVLSAAIAMVAPGIAQAQDAAAVPPQTDSTLPPIGDNSKTADASAQPDVAQGDDIIVTGTRQALETSQNRKRGADTVVDTITATDIGAFPDKSVAEALQRVPGITVNRLAASDDTSHFSADPSGVLIRGLTQVRSEYNGRDTFSANSNRGLSWGDIAPELMAGVDVYKNQTADLIEGGIAGSINLRTRVPFDTKGQVIQATVNANYGDLRQKLTPEVSALYSNNWDTGIGRLGLLGNIAHSELKSQSQGVVFGRTALFDSVYGPGIQYIPSQVGYRETDYDRTRDGIAAAAQWESTDGSLLATVQYNRSKYHEEWREHGLISYPSDLFGLSADTVLAPGATRNPRPAPGTPAFTFDEDGNFATGTLVHQQTDFTWWGNPNAGDPQYTGTVALNSLGQPFFTPCYSWVPCTPDVGGLDVNAVTRFNDTRRTTQDLGFNVKWKASDQLDISFDAQYVDASVSNYDVEVGQYTYANVALDTTGKRPTQVFLAPTNVNLSPGGLANPNNYHYNHVMDHREDDDGTEYAFRADATYRFEGSDWLSSLQVGLRYADRDQTVRYSAFNWGSISQPYNTGNNQYAYWNIDNGPNNGFRGYPSGLIEVRPFGGDYFGGTGNYAFFDMKALEGHRADELSFSNLGVGVGQWQPICSGGGTANVGPRTAEMDGSCYRPDEINRLSETTKAAYAVLKFGGPDASFGSVGVSGNIGLRYIRTEDRSSGSTVFPNAFSVPTCVRNAAPGGLPFSIGCYLYGNGNLTLGADEQVLTGSPNAVAFANSGSSASTVRAKHDNFLPSFNLKLDLSDKWVVRFAASRALSRPDIGFLKNYTTIEAQLPGADANDPRYIRNGAGQVTGVAPLFQGSGYNPNLKPTTATQFDLSVENYFAKVGSFTAGAFYKSFQNYVQYGSEFIEFTNNGVTNSVEIRSPQNGDGGKIYGVEAAYQRFFDFLPGALSGFGVQLNGTYVKNDGIKNSGLKVQSGTQGGSQAQPGSGGTTLTVDALEGLSKYSYNVVGMYEKYGLAVRAAYNWRSKFLVTAVDCCTYLPTWQQAAGFLDASIRYAVTPNIELSIQGSNLLNTETKFKQQVTGVEDGAILAPNAWFQNDRRFVFGARAKF